MGYNLIDKQEKLWSPRALQRLLFNPNIQVLGNTSVKRQPIVSFLIHTTSSSDQITLRSGSNIWVHDRAGARDKPLHSRLVTKLLNDLFGIQSRAGCACAAPYGHILLGISNDMSLRFRSMIEKVYIVPSNF